MPTKLNLQFFKYHHVVSIPDVCGGLGARPYKPPQLSDSLRQSWVFTGLQMTSCESGVLLMNSTLKCVQISESCHGSPAAWIPRWLVTLAPLQQRRPQNEKWKIKRRERKPFFYILSILRNNTIHNHNGWSIQISSSF